MACWVLIGFLSSASATPVVIASSRAPALTAFLIAPPEFQLRGPALGVIGSQERYAPSPRSALAQLRRCGPGKGPRQLHRVPGEEAVEGGQPGSGQGQPHQAGDVG